MPLPYAKTHEELQAIIAAHPKVLVNFTASWCGPCKMIAPQVEVLAQETPGLFVVKVDIDDNEESATVFDVSAVPTFILFKNGARAGDLAGASFDRLKALVAQA